MKVQSAQYDCDFCHKISESEYEYVFKARWDSSVHTTCHHFGLCRECDKSTHNREGMIAALKKWFAKPVYKRQSRL